MKVNFLDLKKQYQSIKDEIDTVVGEVLASSAYSGGPFVERFEKNFAAAHDARFCVAVNNGTSALHALLMALEIGPGDEVIVPVNTFFATPQAVSLTGATPVFVDCEDMYYNIDISLVEKAITSRTKAIFAVHLYGQPAEMDKLKAIAEAYDIHLLEDCAQAHLAKFKGLSVGTIGLAGCFSFYPGKNLGAYGEGGAVITNNEDLYQKLLMIRNHGSAEKYHHEYIGHNFRMSGLQGGILNVKLRHLRNWTDTRRANAEIYDKGLAGVSEIITPLKSNHVEHVYHLYVIRVPDREAFMSYLNDEEIYTGIHYPVPCHLQKAYRHLGFKEGDFPVAEKTAKEIMSLPMSDQLTADEAAYVLDKMNVYRKLVLK